MVDLSLVLALYWGMVWIVLRQAYEKTASELPEGADPEAYVMILPDRGGRLTRAFDLRNTGIVAVVDGEGVIRGVHQGKRPGEAAMEMLSGA